MGNKILFCEIALKKNYFSINEYSSGGNKFYFIKNRENNLHDQI
jgi:hypothetical protein